jgi:demethylmenaquinone methyltransferase/2-methoxy-6-polyprenyl-1,4-benzoquinol methylase
MTRPDTSPDAKRLSWRMFDRIAGRYDLLNRLLSMRRDVAWRRRLRRLLPPGDALRVADIATGTGDVLLEWARDPRVRAGVGVDMSAGMLALGRGKLQRAPSGAALALVRGDGCRLPLADGSCDAAANAFGIRNVPDVGAALREMHRVLKPGGCALVLEFSLPPRPLRAPYLFYFRNVLPRIGALVSGDAEAYRYLNTSVEAFPYGEAFLALMREAGFGETRQHRLSFGIATIYEGRR